jgi:hypothetical protein
MTDQKQPDNMEYFNNLGSTITNDNGCTQNIKYSIATVKSAFKMKALFTSKLNFNLRKNLVKCLTWNIALCSTATWTLRGIIRNAWNVLKCSAGEGMRRSLRPTVRKIQYSIWLSIVKYRT